MRGYTNEDSDLMINGMPMNDLDDGRILWNAWAGLNDVFRVQTDIMNLQANEFGFGGIGGIRMIDLRASDQRKQKSCIYGFKPNLSAQGNVYPINRNAEEWLGF